MECLCPVILIVYYATIIRIFVWLIDNLNNYIISFKTSLDIIDFINKTKLFKFNDPLFDLAETIKKWRQKKHYIIISLQHYLYFSRF